MPVPRAIARFGQGWDGALRREGDDVHEIVLIVLDFRRRLVWVPFDVFLRERVGDLMKIFAVAHDQHGALWVFPDRVVFQHLFHDLGLVVRCAALPVQDR